MPVTRRQREILDYLTEYIEERGYAPSFEEIAQRFQFHSLATVHEHLTNLERKGAIRRVPNTSRGIEVLTRMRQPGVAECFRVTVQDHDGRHPDRAPAGGISGAGGEPERERHRYGPDHRLTGDLLSRCDRGL